MFGGGKDGMAGKPGAHQAITGVAQQLSGAAATLDLARGHMTVGPMGGAPMVGPGMEMMSGAQGPQMAFDHAPMGFDRPMASPMPFMPAPAGPMGGLTDEFSRMRMMESAFDSANAGPATHAPATVGPAAGWAQDMARHRSEEALAMRHMQMQHAMRANAGPTFQPFMHGPAMGMMGDPRWGMSMGMHQPLMTPSMPMMTSMTPVGAVATPVTSTSSAAMVDSLPIATESAPAPTMMGMGMDRAMIEKLRNSDDPKWKNSKFLKFISQVNSGEIELDSKNNRVVHKELPADSLMAGPNAVVTAGSLRPGISTPWDDISIDHDDDEALARDLAESEAADGKWDGEFAAARQATSAGNAGLAGDQEDYGYLTGAALEKAKEMAPKVEDPTYALATANPHADAKDPFAEGVRLLKGGDIKGAILAFEAAVTKTPDNAEAWRYLGQAQAENEEETQAIAALLKCISIDPYNLPALMMLGVSYTNDLEEMRALNYLKTWLLNNPEYQTPEMAAMKAQLAEYEELYGSADGNAVDHTLHGEVAKMFAAAVQVNPRDPDLHTVLGVLYHISNDFDKAIESFKAALKLRPDDPQLWNKLGATQANSSRSADAVHAYRRALSLRPTYVRALANLAISFANQGMHEEAAKAYLATLQHNPNAAHVWSYLRISLSHMGKDDLVALTHQTHDVEQFRAHFKF